MTSFEIEDLIKTAYAMKDEDLANWDKAGQSADFVKGIKYAYDRLTGMLDNELHARKTGTKPLNWGHPDH